MSGTEQAFCPCEGSGAPNRGWCPMCAAVFYTDPIPPHDRVDVLTMIDRGDLDD